MNHRKHPGSPAIVLADPSRDRRDFLEHAFECLGYSSICTACGVEALQLVREQQSPLLVAHIAVPCGPDRMLTRVSQSQTAVSRNTRILWFSERSAPVSSAIVRLQSRTEVVQCGDNPATVVSAVQNLLGPGPAVGGHSSDLLLLMMMLDAELKELPESCLW